MPGGWTMSMAWMRMPGQTWPNAAASFLGMWIVMMVAMMSPSLIPLLWRYSLAIGRIGGRRSDGLIALASAGYFFTWTVFGLAAFTAGALLAAMEMQWPWLARIVPGAAGAMVLTAGALQFTTWKTHHLACCQAARSCCRPWPVQAAAAWRFGLRLGVHCCHCCAGLTAVLLVLGVMDLRAMFAVTAAITAERLAPAAWRVEQVIGVVVIATGLFFIVRATGLV